MRLRPDPIIGDTDLRRGQRALVRDAAWASVTGSLYGGVILVGFALALGAGPFAIGMLAAIPFIGQAAQLPAIALIERLRQRRKIAVVSVTAARVLILLLAIVPLVASTGPGPITWLLVAQLVITILGSLAGCALNSWLHQLLPREGLGAFFAKRLFWGTASGCIGALAAGLLIDHWPYAEKLHAYSVSFGVAGLAGFVSAWFLTRVPADDASRPTHIGDSKHRRAVSRSEFPQRAALHPRVECRHEPRGAVSRRVPDPATAVFARRRHDVVGHEPGGQRVRALHLGTIVGSTLEQGRAAGRASAVFPVHAGHCVHGASGRCRFRAPCA